MPFLFTPLTIPDVFLVETRRFPDERGFFLESYKASEFRENGLPEPFVQDNVSFSKYGVLRGLHYQLMPSGQGKLVLALEGTIWDVAVDIRSGSPTYGQWVAETLSGDNGRMLFIPEGFAHGFCVVSETARVCYKVTREYDPARDRGIAWNDPALGIAWPVPAPLVSPKDAALPLLRAAENTFRYSAA